MGHRADCAAHWLLALCPGAPSTFNSTYFCEATMMRCYVLLEHNEEFSDARAACQAYGGTSDVISYSTGAAAAGACSHSCIQLAWLAYPGRQVLPLPFQSFARRGQGRRAIRTDMPSAHRPQTHMRPLLAGEEQLLVENYFAAAGSLPAAYWNGIYRSGSTNPFKYLSGQLVSDVVGNANPYAHWWAAGPPPALPTAVRCSMPLALCCR